MKILGNNPTRWLVIVTEDEQESLFFNMLCHKWLGTEGILIIKQEGSITHLLVHKAIAESFLQDLKSFSPVEAKPYPGSGPITASQARELVRESQISTAFNRPCTICGVGVGYVFDFPNVAFSSSCGCTQYNTPPKHSTWNDIAKEIGMQTPEVQKRMIAELQGKTI